MNDIEVQNALNKFEHRLLDRSDVETVRAALRGLLFGLAGLPLNGSLGDAIELLSDQTRPSAVAASAVLRALAVDGLVQDNAANHLARNIVSIVENGLPECAGFFKLREKKQTHEKLEQLRKVMAWVDSQLALLRVSYTTLESMLEARKAIQSALAHRSLIEFGAAYRLLEVRDAIVSVYSSLDDVSKVAATLAADVEKCERVIDDAHRLTISYPSFITESYLKLWLQCALQCLHKFIDSMRGRFTAVISQDWPDTDLPKRYPLMESGRDLRILVPFSSDGRGAAMDVRISVASDSQQVYFQNEKVVLNSVSPGKFSVVLDVNVVDACPEVSALLEIEWGEVGTSRRQNAVFEIRVLAQATGIDWEAHTYADPYSTGPAEGEAFVGRQEQVQTLVARMLRRPMEPSYITGQRGGPQNPDRMLSWS